MPDINVGEFSEALNDKADRDLNNTQPLADYVIETQLPTSENNYNWYRLYKSGWIEQGGRVYGSSEQTIHITFQEPMADSNYQVNSSTMGFDNTYTDQSANTFELQVFNLETTGFDVRVVGSSARRTRSWEVKGMSAQ